MKTKNIFFKTGTGKARLAPICCLLLLFCAACSPQEFDSHSMGAPDTVTPDQLAFTATPSEASSNKITFTNTSPLKISYSVLWDLGNGTTGKGNEITGIYPMKGPYTVTMTVYAPDGSSAIKTYEFTLADDDFSLISSSVYEQLTGGIDNAAGKTWVYDRYNRFAKQVAAATGKDVKGHTGLGEAGSYGQAWWGAEPDAKAATQLYDFKFTFKLDGTQLIIQTGGKGYGRWACAADRTGATKDGDDSEFDYTGGAYTFSINEPDEVKPGDNIYPTLTLSDGAVLGYYACNLTYDIFYQADSVMALRVLNTTENQDWVFVFCREDLNVSAPVEPKAVPLSEDFEAETATVAFVPESMGTLTAAGYANPAPVAGNTSAKVFLYEKSDEFYSNLSFTADGYTFDLATVNKIKLKVFIPSYNDYATDYETAAGGNDGKLLPQVAVKLQNSSAGDNAWQTQKEIVKSSLDKDKWLDLTFDFSTDAARKDFDKIVIQFGGEGHAGPGIFFFDDFSFEN
jgi:hypothetical protein